MCDSLFFFFQAEDGIRDYKVTGVQTCALPIYGSALSDGNMHLYKDLPVLLVAGGVAGIRAGRHIRYPENTPMANLYLTLLRSEERRVGKEGRSRWSPYH